MDISDIATQQCLTVAPETRLGKVRSTFTSDTHQDGVLVVEDDDCLGAIQPRDLLRSQYDDDTNAQSVVRSVPTIDRSTNVREAARLLVENRTVLAPVTQQGELWGCITADSIIAAVRENLSVLSVSDIHTSDVIAITEDATLGESLNRLREHGISRLPVVEDDGTLTGIITTDDLAEFIVRDPDQPHKGNRASDTERLLEVPVYDFMSSPVETTTLETTVDEAVTTMLDRGYDGLIVTPEYDELVAGVLTKTDVLRALTYTEEDVLDVQITNAELLRTTTKQQIHDRIEDIVTKHESMNVYHVHVKLQEHHEEFRNTNLIRCQVRLWSDQDSIAGTGEGYGAEDALSLALDKFERNVLELKGKRSDERYRGELLRKLNEL
ncbi:CBS domain-containing protein [Halocatena marina]|uniref:CBS domain-containing protein n=1 Tax=Halocatena marina TaxID=2934937 RepID=UPI002010A9D8|nr:CBS domain-containing protein [Halocatena marina]